VKAIVQNWLHKAKRRIQNRLRPKRWSERPKPMLARQSGLVDLIEALIQIPCQIVRKGAAGRVPSVELESVGAGVAAAGEPVAASAAVLSDVSGSRSPDAPVRRGAEPRKDTCP